MGSAAFHQREADREGEKGRKETIPTLPSQALLLANEMIQWNHKVRSAVPSLGTVDRVLNALRPHHHMGV